MNPWKRWKDERGGGGHNDCFNALITTKMAASDCLKGEVNNALFFKGRARNREEEAKVKQGKKRASVCN